MNIIDFLIKCDKHSLTYEETTTRRWYGDEELKKAMALACHMWYNQETG